MGHRLEMSEQATALWGPLVRGLGILLTLMVLAGLTGVYADTLRNTLELRHGQDFARFYESASSRPRVSASARSHDPHLTSPPPNLNPPHFRVVVGPLTRFNLPTAFTVWMMASAVALGASLIIVCRWLGLGTWGVAALLAFSYASVPMIATLSTGQVGALLLLPVTVAWASARNDRLVSAAVWIGLCASIKPFFLLFAPCFAIQRQFRAAMAVLLPVAVVFGLGVSVYGYDAYRAWVDDLWSVTWAEQYMNAAVLGFVERSFSASPWLQVPLLDAPGGVFPLWVTLCSGIGLATLLRVGALRDIDAQFLLMTTAALLISPLGWTYYLWFLIPPASGMIQSGSLTRVSKMIMCAGLVGLLVPPIVPMAAIGWPGGIGTATLGSVYFWALLALWVVAYRSR